MQQYETLETCRIVKPGIPGSIRIIHYTSKSNVQAILSDGLKTRSELAKKTE